LNGRQQSVAFWVAVLCGAGALAYYFLNRDSSAESTDDWDESGGGASGADSSYFNSVTQGLSIAAATVGYTLGVYTPKGLRNHNPGNLRYVASVPWNGQVGPDDSGYAVFDSDEHGVRAMAHQLQTYQRRGLTTVRAIISTYAPSSENDTAAYIADVCERMGVDPDQPFDVTALLVPLCDAMIHHEQGVQPFSLDQLNTWCYEP
jgi:hypothetical protein